MATPTALAVVEAPSSLGSVEAETVVLPLGSDWESEPLLGTLLGDRGPGLRERLARIADPRRGGSALALTLDGAAGPAWLLCVAVDPDLPAPTAHRNAGVAAAAELASAGALAVVRPRGEDGSGLACRLVEGLGLGAWEPGGDLSPPAAAAPVSSQPEVERAWQLARAVNWARTLVDSPSSELTPARLAAVGAEMGEQQGLSHRIWSEQELREGNFGGILAVGQGAENPPCMLELRRDAEPGARQVALIGKGVTCDTGGLQIKLDDHEWLLADMGGAAAVLAATWAATTLGLQIGLRVLVPCVENMPTATAYRTGDLVRHRDGTTSEVRHTDAEGRLILADAITLAREEDPAAIVEVSTLTDEFALGPQLWALLSNDNELAGRLLEAGERAGDPGWRLPLWAGYRSALKSDRADRANIGLLGAIGAGQTILGGLFLEPFAAGVPLAHIDIAGTAYHVKPGTGAPGPTGSSAAALVEFLAGEPER